MIGFAIDLSVYFDKPFIFILFTPFFLSAEEKGPKLTAPLGAGPVFP
ncbi:MAG: hypothetical protein J4F39_13125 [Candidatus Latescibacteria bacterium]|nr:hypothetical protein [Candidatus Latescibacterota bacterium]